MNRYVKRVVISLSCVLIVTMVHQLCKPERLWGLERKSKPDSSEAHSQNREKIYSDRVECPGTLQADKCFAIYLHPGERVVEIMVRKGIQVERDALLVRLASDALLSKLAAIKEKELDLQQSANRMEVLKLKIQLVQTRIQKLDGLIKKERAINQRIPEYLVAGKLRDWAEVRQQKTDELTVLRKELSHYHSRNEARTQILSLIQKQIIRVKNEIKQLTIKAPFPGKVINVYNFERRMVPQDQVVEICDERSLVVVARAWQHQILHIKPGARAKIFLDFFDSDALMGTVRSIGRAASNGKGDRFSLFPVVIDLDQVSPDLLAGMSVAVEILLPGHPEGS